MSVQDTITVAGQIGRTVSIGTGTITRAAADAGATSIGSTATYWYESLQQASYRGIPFGVETVEGRFGRKNAIHEYPFRDAIWVEDLGRAGRRINVIGFLVEGGRYTPGNVIDQRNQLIAAAEQKGDAKVVLPSYGELTLGLLDFQVRERWDLGRIVQIQFSFAESGLRVFPTISTKTTGATTDAANAVQSEAADTWTNYAMSLLKKGATEVKKVADAVSQYAATAQTAINNATNLYNLAKTLSGQFGRFVSGTAGSLALLSAAASVSRDNFATSVSKANSNASLLKTTNASSFPATAQAVATSVRSACTTPRDAITALQQMATTSGAGGIAGYTQDMLRRAAVVEMAKASSEYSPTSYDDAQALIVTLCGYLDAEILAAGDQGEDSLYMSLRTLRSAVVEDLTERGADLSTVVTVSTRSPIPALVLAQKLYKDPARADELVTRGNPISPLFMPTKFKALAS